jgi:ubiquinone biosynthesis protein
LLKVVNRFLPVPWFTRPHLFARSQQIVSVLSRRGLGMIFSRLALGLTGRRTRIQATSDEQRKQASKLREALLELGPTFIKLGQALSARPDLLPVPYVEELSKLQDEVPPSTFEKIRLVLQEELKKDPGQVFATFDPNPIASASIGQVYAATLKTGQEVVVKVVRPGVISTVEIDLEILNDMAVWAENSTSLGENYDLLGLLDEFSFRLRNELDYQREGHNADTFRQLFHGDAAVYIPRVYWEYTTARVITMERVKGIKITDTTALTAAGINPKDIAVMHSHFTMRQLVEFGFFHADPHPGNYYVQPDATLAVMDFGMVGRFSPQTKNALLRIVMAAAHSDADGLVDELLDMGITSPHINRQELKMDLGHMLDTYSGGNFQFLTGTKVVNQIMDMAFRHGLQMPGELAMLGRLVVVNEGIMMGLDPGFRMLEFAVPYMTNYWKKQHSPQILLPRLGQASLDGLELSLDLPRQATRLLKQLERGQMEISLNTDRLDTLMLKMQKMTNRLAISILLGATIIALGLVAVVYHPETWQSIGQMIFIFAFVSSLAFGLWLMISVWRSGRK